MRIERLTVEAFGRLTDFDTGPEPLGPLVVVVGPNEAGKSTLFTFLTTALYGFHPASRESNPHVPWGTEEAGGEVRVRLADDGCARVERQLRSSPKAKLSLGSTTRTLRNQPVPWVEHVPRAVFRQVFAITLSELAGLDEETWARIQDRVLGSMGATDLRPARAVAERLEREAGELWRPNRRGNQRIRELQDEIRRLRGARLEALERDRVVRQRVKELAGVRHTLRELREERTAEEVVLERVQELLPVKRQLERIGDLRRAGGPREPLTALPDDLREAFEQLGDEGARLDAERARLETDRAEPLHALERWDDDARRLQEARAEIGALVRRVDAAPDSTRVSELEATERDLDARIRSAADQLLSDPGAVEGVRSVSLELLRDRVGRAEALRAAAAARSEGDRASGVPEARPEGSVRVAAVIALLAGIACIAWGALGGPSLAGTFGAASAAVGLTLLVVELLRPGAGADAETPVRDPLEEAEAEIARLVSGLPLRPPFLAPAGSALVSAVERLQVLLYDRDETARARGATEEERTAVAHEADRLAARVGWSTRSPEELAETLPARLLEADRAEEAARSARRELERLDRTLSRLKTDRDDLKRRERTLRESVVEIAGPDTNDTNDTVAAVQRRLDAHARADRLEDELERSRPDLADARARIEEAEREGATWVLSDSDLAVRRARLGELRERIETLVGRAEALDTEIGHLRELETVDSVDGEILTLQDEEKRLTFRRDRTWVLAQLLREADRRFREEHQPDLLRQASSYLERLTEGRYTRILVDELGEGDLFQLVGPGLPRPIPLARPISTGTLEQAYLSLRLAIVDHLDRGAERLPLFIDEALVNWDAARRERGLGVLAELSETRQVFAFTCHDGMANHLEAHGARVLRLAR